MRSSKHFFTKPTDMGKIYADVTVETTQRELEHRPSEQLVNGMKDRLVTKKKHWEPFIKAKEGKDAALKAEKDEEVRLYWENRLKEEAEQRKREEEEANKEQE